MTFHSSVGAPSSEIWFGSFNGKSIPYGLSNVVYIFNVLLPLFFKLYFLFVYDNHSYVISSIPIQYK